jgi:hypothetical protein
MRLSEYLEEIPVKVPVVESATPIIIRLCPDLESRKFYKENGYVYFNKEKGVNCNIGSGGAGGGGG